MPRSGRSTPEAPRCYSKGGSRLVPTPSRDRRAGHCQIGSQIDDDVALGLATVEERVIMRPIGGGGLSSGVIDIDHEIGITAGCIVRSSTIDETCTHDPASRAGKRPKPKRDLYRTQGRRAARAQGRAPDDHRRLGVARFHRAPDRQCATAHEPQNEHQGFAAKQSNRTTSRTTRQTGISPQFLKRLFRAESQDRLGPRQRRDPEKKTAPSQPRDLHRLRHLQREGTRVHRLHC